jgi:hypothetical protein
VRTKSKELRIKETVSPRKNPRVTGERVRSRDNTTGIAKNNFKNVDILFL